MASDRNNVKRITLNGDLSMVGVKEQFSLLAKYVARPAEAAAAGCERTPHEIDLTGIQGLDACGCQLLAAFLGNLKQRGVEAYSFKLNDTYREKIHSLGFDDELFARDCA